MPMNDIYEMFKEGILDGEIKFMGDLMEKSECSVNFEVADGCETVSLTGTTATDNTTGTVYDSAGNPVGGYEVSYPQDVKPTPFAPYSPPIFIGDFHPHIRPQEDKDMSSKDRSIYTVYVVDPAGNNGDGEIVAKSEDVIAQNFEGAKMKAVKEHANVLQQDLESYDFVIEDVGDWGSIRPK